MVGIITGAVGLTMGYSYIAYKKEIGPNKNYGERGWKDTYYHGV